MLGLAVLDGLGDDAMLGQGATKPVRCSQLQTTIGLQGPAQRVGMRAQVGIAAGIVDYPVEPRVGVVVAV